MGREVFTVSHAAKSFHDVMVLRDVSFGVNRGEIFGLIGASGAGKTTILNLLVGFVRPDKGIILFTRRTAAGEESFNVLEKPLVLSTCYGFAAQNPSFYDPLSVLENLRYFGTMYNLSERTLSTNIETLLKLLDLRAARHALAKDLSGGMKRRLDIACALVHNPEVLILDEPTADLDPVLRNQIWDVVRKVNARGTTVILSSHHLNELDTLCTRIAMLKDGALVDLDTPEKLKAKHHRVQEILIESYPGSYARLLPDLKGKDILEAEHSGTYLRIRTQDPQRILRDVLGLLERHHEQLLDIRLHKPNLDDVFVRVYAKQGERAPDAKAPRGGGA